MQGARLTSHPRAPWILKKKEENSHRPARFSLGLSRVVQPCGKKSGRLVSSEPDLWGPPSSAWPSRAPDYLGVLAPNCPWESEPTLPFSESPRLGLRAMIMASRPTLSPLCIDQVFILMEVGGNLKANKSPQQSHLAKPLSTVGPSHSEGLPCEPRV